MLRAIDHQCNASSCGRCARYSPNVLLVPGRITNKRVVKSLRSQVGSFPRGEAHTPLECGVSGKNAPYDGHTAQRLGGEAYAFAASMPKNVGDVLIEQVKVEVCEWHRTTFEDCFVVGVVVL